MNKYYISTAIPYINASAHIGHVQEFLLADTIKKVLQSQGHEVFFQSGTDDNSLKNILSAEKLSLDPKDYIKLQGEKFYFLLKTLGISLDAFVQTSSPRHHRAVTKFIKALNPNDLFNSQYRGLYCVGCEDYLKETELTSGVCPDHKVPPTIIEEENVFFKLSRYQAEIEELIESNRIKIYPPSRKKEILSFIKSGLQDISISRPTTDNISIAFPGTSGQSVYVWIDALINYLTGTGYGTNSNWTDLWNKDVYKVHVIGKNVWKFHAVYWIGLLLSAKIDLPNEIIIHGFLTSEGQKISKSLGNSLDPLELLKEVDRDDVRGYLLGRLNYETDSDFKLDSLKQFHEDVLNQVGNLYPRVLKLSRKYKVKTLRVRNEVTSNFRSLNSIFSELLSLSQVLNKEINDSLIWKSPEGTDKNKILTDWVLRLNQISDRVELFFPDKTSLIESSFKGEDVVLFKK